MSSLSQAGDSMNQPSTEDSMNVSGIEAAGDLIPCPTQLQHAVSTFEQQTTIKLFNAPQLEVELSVSNHSDHHGGFPSSLFPSPDSSTLPLRKAFMPYDWPNRQAQPLSQHELVQTPHVLAQSSFNSFSKMNNNPDWEQPARAPQVIELSEASDSEPKREESSENPARHEDSIDLKIMRKQQILMRLIPGQITQSVQYQQADDGRKWPFPKLPRCEEGEMPERLERSQLIPKHNYRIETLVEEARKNDSFEARMLGQASLFDRAGYE